MKIYVAHYYNGEYWGDSHDSIDEKVYTNREDCVATILENGYILNDRGVYSVPESEEGYYPEYYQVDELELVIGK